MFYRNELRFLCDTFKKCRIHTTIALYDAPIGQFMDERLSDFIDKTVWDTPLHVYLKELEPSVVYKCADPFGLQFMILELPGMQQRSVLVMGPYVTQPFTQERALEVFEKCNIPVKSHVFLRDYLSSVPVMGEQSPLLMMVDTFAECIWGGAPYTFVDVVQEPSFPVSPISKAGEGGEVDESLANIRRMELRYEYENELMTAVSLGQTQKANLLLTALSSFAFDRRVADPQRNMKNYSVIMNTLLRKAAEQGGVHPVYLDRVSSDYAIRIEQASTLDDITAMMSQMFIDYCRLVRKHSLGEYSPIVQKTIIFIESDLSANLTLSTLAAAQKVSPGYLSTVFKKETGKTLTEYITRKRMKHAAHLLTTTHLQVQTIALHCGIVDVQYFSKLFKRHMGMTPGEYRHSRP